MVQGSAWTALTFLIATWPALAQTLSPRSADKEEKGTYLGILLAPVPEVLYDQLPNLPRGQGVVITHILPESPAKEAGIERHDILLKYDAVKVTGCEQCARLDRKSTRLNSSHANISYA